jgi:hypothetical protein
VSEVGLKMDLALQEILEELYRLTKAKNESRTKHQQRTQKGHTRQPRRAKTEMSASHEGHKCETSTIRADQSEFNEIIKDIPDQQFKCVMLVVNQQAQNSEFSTDICDMMKCRDHLT